MYKKKKDMTDDIGGINERMGSAGASETDAPISKSVRPSVRSVQSPSVRPLRPSVRSAPLRPSVRSFRPSSSLDATNFLKEEKIAENRRKMESAKRGRQAEWAQADGNERRICA